MMLKVNEEQFHTAVSKFLHTISNARTHNQLSRLTPNLIHLQRQATTWDRQETMVVVLRTVNSLYRRLTLKDVR